MKDENKSDESYYVPSTVIEKILKEQGIKQPKDSIKKIQRTISAVMDDFIDRLTEIKQFDTKKKVTEEDIKDLIERDEIVYLKGGGEI